MRRRALHLLFRTARRPFIRSLHSQRNRPQSYRGPEWRRDQARAAGLHTIHSSMHLRSFSAATVAALVGGAWYAYKPSSSTSNNNTDANFAKSFSNAAVEAGQHVVAATRKALILDQDQLYTGTISGDGPLTKTTDEAGRQVLEQMTPEQATDRLREKQESYLVGRGKGVVRYDVVQLPSNQPIEDDHSEKIVEVPVAASSDDPQSPGTATSDWMFWGVFDGHSGWTTSAKLRQTLISYVARELNSTYSSARSNSPSSSLPTPELIDAAIKRGFLTLDNSIVHDSVNEVFKYSSKAKAANLLAPALSGSCALLSFYDTASKTLRVACTGDSRAILGRRSTTHPSKWTALALSEDQTGGTPSEMARLREEHPGEPNVVSAGRILGGLEPSRAFGDASYKWSLDVQRRIKADFFGRTASSLMRTPPYVTAEPVVTTTKVEPERGDFMVLATDGLWEMLTNEEVVGLVGQWLERYPEAQRGSGTVKPQYHHAAGSSSSIPSGAGPLDNAANSWLKSWFGGSSSLQQKLPVDINNDQTPESSQSQSGDTTAQNAGQRPPLRQSQWGLSPSTSPDSTVPTSDRFVVEDNNVATHLVRNALGGRDREMVCALLTLPSPYSRRYRDDLTVSVVFFGEGDAGDGGLGDAKESGTGDEKGMGARVVVNEEATAEGLRPGRREVKAKL